MRIFYYDEAPIDTLLQIAEKPIWDGNLVSKSDRSEFVRLGWVDRCQGWNIITNAGREIIKALKLSRRPKLSDVERAENLKVAFVEHHIPYPPWQSH